MKALVKATGEVITVQDLGVKVRPRYTDKHDWYNAKDLIFIREKEASISNPDLNLTAKQMNAIHEKIVSGMIHGLNAKEIEATFNRHVTKALLIRVIMEHIDSDY